MKNYYQILEVPQNAEATAIRKSYYRLAKLYHPDVNPGNKLAEEKFKAISAAYEVLGDPLKRSFYDMQLHYQKNQHSYSAQGSDNAGKSNERAHTSYAKNPYARSRDEVRRDNSRSRSFRLTAALVGTLLFINTLNDGGCNNPGPEYKYIHTTPDSIMQKFKRNYGNADSGPQLDTLLKKVSTNNIKIP